MGVFSSFPSFTLLITYDPTTDLTRQYITTPLPVILTLRMDNYKVGKCLWHYNDPVPVGLGMEARTSDCSSVAKSRSRYLKAFTFPSSVIYITQWCMSAYRLPELHVCVLPSWPTELHVCILSYCTTCLPKLLNCMQYSPCYRSGYWLKVLFV